MILPPWRLLLARTVASVCAAIMHRCLQLITLTARVALTGDALVRRRAPAGNGCACGAEHMRREILGGAVCARCGTVLEVWPAHPITGQRAEPAGYAAVGLAESTGRPEIGLWVTPRHDGGATVRVCCKLLDGAHGPACTSRQRGAC